MKLSHTLILAALVGCLSAYLAAHLFRKWITEDAARERERITNHAKRTKQAIELYAEGQGIPRKPQGG